MKTLSRRLFVVACASMLCLGSLAKPSSAQDAPSVKKIIELHIKSFGGRAKLEAVKTAKTVGVMSMPGPAGDIECEMMAYQAGNKFLMIMEIPGFGELKQGCDGKNFWMINPMEGPKLLDAEESAAMASQYAQPFPCLAWSEFEGKIKSDGTEEVDGTKCHKLVFKPTDGAPVERYFDVANGRLLKMVTTQKTPQGQMDVTVYPADFKESGGITIPFKQITEMAFGEMTMEVEEVKYNVKVKDSKFKLPKKIQDLVDGK